MSHIRSILRDREMQIAASMEHRNGGHPDAAGRELGRTPFVVGLIVATLLGAGLRLYQLDAPSFWVDELFTVNSAIALAQGDWMAKDLGYVPSMVALWLAGLDPASLPAGMYGQWKALGIDEWLVRIPYSLIGIVSIPLLGLMSLRVMSRRAALMAVILLAVMPWHLWMSQTGRFYILQFLLYNACLLFYFDGTARGSARGARWSVVWAAVMLVLAFSTQLTSLLIVGIFGLDWLISRLRKEPVRLGLFGWGVMGAATAICLARWGLHFVYEPDHYTHFEGSKQSGVDLLLGLPYLVGVPMAAMAVLAGLWLMQTRPRLAVYLGLGAVVPLITFMGFALIGFDVHVRYIFISLYSWVALTALGLEGLWRASRAKLRPVVEPEGGSRTGAGMGAALVWAPMAVVVASALLMDFAYFTGGMGFRERWRDAFTYVASHREAGEAVAADYIPHIVGQYYLQDDEVLLMNTTTRSGDLAAVNQPVWVVVHAVSATGGRRLRWLDESAELEAYFTNRVLQPYASVHVYRYADPSGPEAGGVEAGSAGPPTPQGAATY